jgi:hypothetical protein
VPWGVFPFVCIDRVLVKEGLPVGVDRLAETSDPAGEMLVDNETG